MPKINKKFKIKKKFKTEFKDEDIGDFKFKKDFGSDKGKKIMKGPLKKRVKKIFGD